MLQVIKLKDGIEVEIEVEKNTARPISHNKNVETSLKEMQSLLAKVIKPISNTFNSLQTEVEIAEAKVTVGVKLNVEGNFILAKSSVEANFQVELLLRPQNG
jgi:predicted DNA-binding antitoxin AbrB/MazE fold protein